MTTITIKTSGETSSGGCKFSLEFDNLRELCDFYTMVNVTNERIQGFSSLVNKINAAFNNAGVSVVTGQPECVDSPDGKHDFFIDLEYDSSGKSVSCRHCGFSKAQARQIKKRAAVRKNKSP